LSGSIAFSPDGKRLATATGSFDKTAKIWDSENGKEILILRGHTYPIHSVAFSSDGKQLATGSNDNTAKIWEFTPGGWRATPQGRDRRLASLTAKQLAAFNLEPSSTSIPITGKNLSLPARPGKSKPSPTSPTPRPGAAAFYLACRLSTTRRMPLRRRACPARGDTHPARLRGHAKPLGGYLPLGWAGDQI